MNTSSRRPTFLRRPAKTMRRKIAQQSAVVVVLLFFAGCIGGESLESEEPIGSASSAVICPNPWYMVPHTSIATNVAGIGMASTGRTYTWYRDNTVTSGFRTDLDRNGPPYTYTIPGGRYPSDIVAMAISASDKVYTWYDDGNRSVGSSSNLGAYSLGAPYTLPYKPGSTTVRYLWSDIVDIAIVNSNDLVYTYFSDYKMSVGNSTNLGAYSTPPNYAPYEYKPADCRSPSTILGIAQNKATHEMVSWYWDGYVAAGAPWTQHLDGATRPFSQHITVYSSHPGFQESEPGFPPSELQDPVVMVRGDLDPVVESTLAPGQSNIAVAEGGGLLRIFRKPGERIMSQTAQTLFQDFLHPASDPVLDINNHNDLRYTEFGTEYDCATGYTDYTTRYNHAACVWQAYDTRAAYDSIGHRFVFLANARNNYSAHNWNGTTCGAPGYPPCSTCSGDECAYNDSNNVTQWVDNICGIERRHLMIAVSKSEDPADGFHLYAIKESNYRDWPRLAISGNQLIVGHKNGIQGPAYCPTEPKFGWDEGGYAALVFDLADLRAGSKRPKYFRLDKNNAASELMVPRVQDENDELTLVIGNDTYVYGFSRSYSGYVTPTIFKSNTTLGGQNETEELGDEENWIRAYGALRLAKTAHGEIYYARYAVETTSSTITINTTPGQCVPWGPLSLPENEYTSFLCGRLAMTTEGDEVIGFTGIRDSGFNSTYDAAFVHRPNGMLNYFGPLPYSMGTFPNSDLDQIGNLCGEQAGVERDPFSSRVWMNHSYGLQGSQEVLRGALGWVSIP